MARRIGLGSDTQAAIAVEFALLAPVMLAMLLGSLSAAHLARASMKAWNVAQSLGELIGRSRSRGLGIGM